MVMVSLVVAVHPDCKMAYAEPSLVEATLSDYCTPAFRRGEALPSMPCFGDVIRFTLADLDSMNMPLGMAGQR